MLASGVPRGPDPPAESLTATPNQLEWHLDHQMLVDTAGAAGGRRDVVAELGVRTRRRLLAGQRVASVEGEELQSVDCGAVGHGCQFGTSSLR